MVYYKLPKLDDKVDVTLEIRNSKNELVNTISSKSDSDYKRWDGGPPPAATISKKEGLNRFVWDMRYPIMSGIPDTYIEASFRGHRTPPGTYKLTLKAGEITVSTNAVIIENPNYEIKPGQYQEYDKMMTEMETNLTDMHDKVNMLYKAKSQLKDIVVSLKKDGKTDSANEGQALIDKITKWDEDMIQRKSKAYDDVENFPNKFTAEYIFLINQTDSSIPRVNDQNRNRKNELDGQWNTLKSKANSLINTEIPNFNKQLWGAGIGAIKMN